MSEPNKTGRSILGLLARAVRVIVAFALAAALALSLLFLLGANAAGEELRDGYRPDGELAALVETLSLLLGGTSFLLALAPTLTLLPAFVAVLVGEVAAIRSSLYYIVAGGLALLALPLLGSPPDTRFDPRFMAIFATAGFAGGLLYWLLAGRKA